MFMNEARQVLEKYAPELDAHLSRLGFIALENMKPQKLTEIIRQYNLPGLLIPKTLNGRGISAYESIRIQRAIGTRSPSMAIMLTMHNFTISFCSNLAEAVPACADMLRKVAEENLLVASAFAEGRYGAGILDSTVYVIRDSAGGYRINGSKKPCTMANCMDIITLGIAEKQIDGSKRNGMAILFANQPGITRHQFWNTSVLAAADSHELRFENVRVTENQVLLADDDQSEISQIVAAAEITGLCWFEIVASASYLGIVSGLAEPVLLNTKIDPYERARLGGELESAQAALDGAIKIMEIATVEQSLLSRILFIRFTVQRIIEQCAMHACELSGGLSFVRDEQMTMLLAASRCLAFHPISRKAAEPILAEWLSGPQQSVKQLNLGT